MDLVIDIGNTRIKYAAFTKGEMQTKDSCFESELEMQLEPFSGKTKNLLLSSVNLISEKTLKIARACCENSIVLTSDIAMPFKNCYETPQSLGSDRLALVAGALSKFPEESVLVVDVGTCMTFDFIDAQASYQGGAISPGLNMRLKALHLQTGKLPLVDLEKPKDLIGKSTKASILSGVVNGMINELDGTIDAYKLRYPEMKIVLTGGDITFFDNKLKNSIFVDADILLNGMYFILKKHANKKI